MSHAQPIPDRDADLLMFSPRENDPFPLECLPPVMRVIVVSVCESVLVPAALAGPSALACHAASLGAGLAMPTKPGSDRFTHGNLYFIAAAPSGSGKGETYRILASPLEKWAEEEHERWQKKVRPQALAQLEVIRLKLEKARKPEEKADLIRQRDEQELLLSPPCLLAGEFTSAALVPRIQTAPGHALACFAPESREMVKILLGIFREGQSDDALLIVGHTVETYRRMRKGGAGKFDGDCHTLKPCLSLLWLAQPDQIRHIAERDDLTSGGFSARTPMFDTGTDCVEIPEIQIPLDKVAMAEWSSLIAANLKSHRERRRKEGPALVKVAPEVFELMRLFENCSRRMRNFKGPWPALIPMLSRWADTAWRIALNLHVALHGEDAISRPVSGETARDAITLSQWLARQTLALHLDRQERVDTDKLAKLSGAIRSLLGKGIPPSLSELKKRHNFSGDEVERLVRLFPKTLRIKEERTGARGPETRLVEILGASPPDGGR